MSPNSCYGESLSQSNHIVQFKEMHGRDFKELDLSTIYAKSNNDDGSLLSGYESVSCLSNVSAPSALRESKYSSYPYARSDINSRSGKRKSPEKKKSKKKSPRKVNNTSSNAVISPSKTNMLPPIEKSDADDDDSISGDSPVLGTYSESPRPIILPALSGEANVEVFTPQPAFRKKNKKKYVLSPEKSISSPETIAECSPMSQSSDAVSEIVKSGTILMRSSKRSLLFKNWKECVWVYSKPAGFLFFSVSEGFHNISGKSIPQ